MTIKNPNFFSPLTCLAIHKNAGEEVGTRRIATPVGINQHIGRRPIAAFGNSDGDLQMLQWTAAGNGSHLCLYMHHTDGTR